MSKKHKRHIISTPSQGAAHQPAGLSHEAEYRIIKFDLVKVLVLNLVYLVAILALYYANLHSGFVDSWFAKVLHF